ncbi:MULTISPECIES: hypothetical protein [Acetobacter]|jgi:hypothetical protein|uniref:Glycine zipper domain-containing protein n=2 Tax=Acetobacteraceae TaxID=433 RepID=A0A841QKM8_9PROT|nr:hypothetical protein [Acetobacter lovaniensis]MBB6458542.1 hypothetical protein [Acetobacter lovaniensis]NHN82743.1 hypothetical protein [Acetobacter lovaniensis]
MTKNPTTETSITSKTLPRKFFLLPLAGCMFLTSCANSANDPSLSPQERQLRQRQAQFDTTVAEGAALLGGLAAIGVGVATHSAKNAALAGAGGALLGGAIGYAIASRTQAQEMSEDDANQAIAHYQQQAAQSQQDTLYAQQTAAAAQQELVVLHQQLAANQISVSDYQEKIARYQKDLAAIKAIRAGYVKDVASAGNLASGRSNAAAAAAVSTMNASIANMGAAQDSLANNLGAAAASGVAGGNVSS